MFICHRKMLVENLRCSDLAEVLSDKEKLQRILLLESVEIVLCMMQDPPKKNNIDGKKNQDESLVIQQEKDVAELEQLLVVVLDPQ